jgi:hypothetical protein
MAPRRLTTKPSSLQDAFEGSKPDTVKVTLEGLDLLNGQSGALRMGFGHLGAIKVRFWVQSDKTDDLMAALLEGYKPEIDIKSSDINAVLS